MVIDKLKNAPLYYGLGQRFQQALEWLAKVDPDSLTPGQRVDIDGDNVYATRFDVDTKLPRRLQAGVSPGLCRHPVCGIRHRGHGLFPARRPSEAAQRVHARHPVLYHRLGHRHRPPGTFYIVWPQDLHAPRVALESPAPVKVIVAKVKLN